MTDKPMTDDELAAIEARAEAAIPGPWLCEERRWEGPDGPRTGQVFTSGCGCDPDGPLLETDLPTAAFLAHARSDVPALLAEIRRLRDGIRQIASGRLPCLTCGSVRDEREIVGADEYGQGRHVTFTDPDDGHIYASASPAAVAVALLGDDDGTETL